LVQDREAGLTDEMRDATVAERDAHPVLSQPVGQGKAPCRVPHSSAPSPREQENALDGHCESRAVRTAATESVGSTLAVEAARKSLASVSFRPAPPGTIVATSL
jgi:hypothetical protein